MNYFDEENRIIEHFQGVDCKSVFFPFQSDIAIHIFESIHDIDNWGKWVNSSGKSDPPPDFYCKDFRYMMDVMRVDDHSFKNKKGKLVNPVNMRESKIQAELIKKGIPELFPNVNGIIVNAVTDLPTQEDHNYKFYKKNFVRAIEQHKSKIDLYRSNHPDYKLIFFVVDESSGYIQTTMPEMAQRKNVQAGEKYSGYPHFYFWDEYFLKPVIGSDIDFLIWFTPFKYIWAETGLIDLPHVCVYDVKSMDIETKKYDENLMMSYES